MKSLVIKYKSKKNGKIVTKWGVLDPQNPGKILRSYDKKEDADKSAKVTKPINEEIGQGETTWVVDKLKPDFENLANYVSDAASEWLDNNEDDANTEDLCKYIADFIVERKETVLKEFGKAVIYTILKEWYICDDDDVNKLVDSVESYIEDDL